MNKYGQRLAELRKANHMTQEQLAVKLNTSRSRIGMYEQGRRQPDFETQEAIADLFNVNIDYLFGRKYNPVDGSCNEEQKEIHILIESLNEEGRQHLIEYAKFLRNNYQKEV